MICCLPLQPVRRALYMLLTLLDAATPLPYAMLTSVAATLLSAMLLPALILLLY